MKSRAFWGVCLTILAAGLPGIAHAYVGPGAGLSLVAAFWAILAAVGTILAFTLMWPIRRMLRNRRAGRPAVHDRTGADESGDVPHGRVHGS
ncbi:MAG TPA: hypothetical protein VIR38_13480 [Thalassobaculum sp.]